MMEKTRRAADLTIEQAALELRVHRNTVYRLIQQGLLDATKVRGRWAIPPRALRKVTESSYPWLNTLQRVKGHFEEMRELLSSTQIALAVTNAEGRFVAVSHRYADLFGYDVDWFHRHSYLDYTPVEDRARTQGLVHKALKELGHPHMYTREVIASWGRRIAVEFEVVAVQLDPCPDSSQIVCRASRS